LTATCETLGGQLINALGPSSDPKPFPAHGAGFLRRSQGCGTSWPIGTLPWVCPACLEHGENALPSCIQTSSVWLDLSPAASTAPRRPNGASAKNGLFAPDVGIEFAWTEGGSASGHPNTRVSVAIRSTSIRVAQCTGRTKTLCGPV